MADLQEDLKQRVYEGTAGGGVVTDFPPSAGRCLQSSFGSAAAAEPST